MRRFFFLIFTSTCLILGTVCLLYLRSGGKIENVIHPFDHFVLGIDVHAYEKSLTLSEGMPQNQIVAIMGEPLKVEKEDPIYLWFGDKGSYGKEFANPNKTFWYTLGGDMNCYVIFDASDTANKIIIGGT